MKRESATFTAEFWTFPASINLCSTIKINVKPSEITWHVSSSRKVKKDLLNPHRKLKLIEEFSRFSKVLLLQFLFKYCNIKVELLRTNWVIEVEVYFLLFIFFFTKSCITLKWISFLKNGRFGLLRRIDLTLRLTAKPNRKKSLVLRNWKMILQSSSTFFFQVSSATFATSHLDKFAGKMKIEAVSFARQWRPSLPLSCEFWRSFENFEQFIQVIQDKIFKITTIQVLRLLPTV